MAEWSRGLKSGIVAGVIYGILAGVITLISMIAAKDLFMDQLRGALASLPSGTPVTIDQLYSISLIGAVPGSVFSGIITGAVIGLVFALLYNDLLGKNSKFRGIFLSLLLLAAATIGQAAAGEGLNFLMISVFFLPVVPLYVAVFLAFGWLLGFFWDRFEAKKHKK